MDASFLSSDIFQWVVLPGLIFLSRILDVTIGTIRIIFVSKGKKFLAPMFGFFEVIIWLVAISQIMKNLSNVACYLAYGAGFATGNFVGITIEERLAMGLQEVRVITAREAAALIQTLARAGYGVTSVDAHGANGTVTLVSTIIKRKDLPNVVTLIKEFDPKAFYSVEDTRSVNEGVFPRRDSRRSLGLHIPGLTR